MRTTTLFAALLAARTLTASGTDTLAHAKAHFHVAKQELADMLEGRAALSYERAIAIMENAYWEGTADVGLYERTIGFHAANVQRLIEAGRDHAGQDFRPNLTETAEQKRAKYENALANWAIFTYLTDTALFIERDRLYFSLPFTYSTEDPLGTADWTNTQIFSLLDNGRGNCFALVSLYKILAERLGAEAHICTAPGHIYIRHADHRGTQHNVELATRTFPGTGTLETLTYTTDAATRNGISLRELNLRQSIALCLVYLAKGYGYKFGVKDDGFMLECAELALGHDSLNLNAMLLKAEVMEERMIATGKPVAELRKDTDFREYEGLLARMHGLGYREMPLEMKNTIIAELSRDTFPSFFQNKTPQPFKHLGVKGDRYATLSWGLFEEFDHDRPVERYGRTLFDAKKKAITGFAEVEELYNSYSFDPVVFAWQIDPLAHKYPMLSPYVGFANNPIYFIDPDGQEVIPTNKFKANESLATFFKLASENTVFRNVMKDFYNNHNHVWIHIDQIKNKHGVPTGVSNVAVTQADSHLGNPVGKYGQHRIIVNADILTASGEIGIDRTFLLMAMVHEGDHARSFERRRQNQAKGNEDYENWPGHHDFIKGGRKGGHHNQMAAFNRQILIDAMQQFDDQLRKAGETVPDHHTDEWYEAMSWYGMRETRAWDNFSKKDPVKAGRYSTLISDQVGKMVESTAKSE